MTRARWRIGCAALCLVAATACSRASSENPEAQGDRLFAQKRFRPAAQAYGEALRLTPDRPEVREKLGRALAGARDFVRAAEMLPDDVDIEIEAARLELKNSRFDDAATRLTRLTAAAPTNALALTLSANATAHLALSFWPLTIIVPELGSPDRAAALRLDSRPAVVAADDARAEELYARAIDLAPELDEARIALANLRVVTGRVGAAVEPLRVVADRSPQDAVASYALGAIYLATGRAQDALPYMKQAVGVESETRRAAQLTLADIYMSLQRTDEARELLTPMLAADEDGAATVRLARLEGAGGNIAAAVRRLNALLARRPTSRNGSLLKARLLFTAGNPDPRFARTAVDLDAGSSEPRLLLGDILAANDDGQGALEQYREAARRAPLDTRPLLALSRASLDVGRAQQALSHARDALRLAPGSKDAALAVVTALIAQPDLNAASSTLAPVAARLPNDPDVALIEGRLALARGDAAGARTSFARALAVRSSIEALDGLVRAEGNQPSASTRQRVEAAVEASPSVPELRLLAGRIYRAARELPRAEAALQQAQLLSPSHVPVALELAGLLMGERKPEAAAAALERVIPTRPARLSDIRVALAGVYQAQGRRAEAQRQYEQLVVEMPGSVDASVVLSTMYLEQRDKLQQALELALAAKRGRPLDPDIDLLLGRIYNEKGMGSLAVPVLEHAVEVRPGSASYHFHLGAAYELAGNMSKARAEYAQALQLDPNLPNADRARQMAASRR